jgi:hypothetical protein
LTIWNHERSYDDVSDFFKLSLDHAIVDFDNIFN